MNPNQIHTGFIKSSTAPRVKRHTEFERVPNADQICIPYQTKAGLNSFSRHSLMEHEAMTKDAGLIR